MTRGLYDIRSKLKGREKSQLVPSLEQLQNTVLTKEMSYQFLVCRLSDI